ncbi:hypothetical protein ALC60_05865, partial [Trachymyrmex zeteki]
APFLTEKSRLFVVCHSVSQGDTYRREALRQGFGRRTKAELRSTAATAAIFLNGQPIVESPWKLAHRVTAHGSPFPPSSVLAGIMFFHTQSQTHRMLVAESAP